VEGQKGLQKAARKDGKRTKDKKGVKSLRKRTCQFADEVDFVTPVTRYRSPFPIMRPRSPFTNSYHFGACLNVSLYALRVNV
jgi:hypothetical protein